MSNIFAGIYRANDALTASRYGLDVTGQNIANANTPGYTRQRADQVSVGTVVGVPTLFSGRLENGGVRADGAVRLNDPVLDTRMRDEHAKQGQVDTTAARMGDIQNIFNEPSDTGLAEQLHDFWNAWGDVANDAGAQVPRDMLISSADKTVTMLHAMNSSLDSVATASKNSLDATVQSVNSAAKELADLNTKIAIGSATNTNVNALLDRRDVLLDQLSTSVGAKATLNNNGTVSVTLPGVDSGGNPVQLQLVTTGPAQNGAPGLGGPPFEYGALTATYTTASGSDVPLTASLTISDIPGNINANPPTSPSGTSTSSVTLGGSAANAEMQTINATVKNYRDKLDAVAQALAKTVNTIQSGHTSTGPGDPAIEPGYDLKGQPGTAMFTTGGPSGSAAISDITAANISVADGFTYDKVAAASTVSTSGTVDGSNALAAADAGTKAGSPDSSYSALIGALGRDAASATQQQTTQGVITASVSTLQANASGVSFDEEVSNMLTYQMAFQASSRVLTTLDDMLDTLINRTGLVGR